MLYAVSYSTFAWKGRNLLPPKPVANKIYNSHESIWSLNAKTSRSIQLQSFKQGLTARVKHKVEIKIKTKILLTRATYLPQNAQLSCEEMRKLQFRNFFRARNDGSAYHCDAWAVCIVTSIKSRETTAFDCDLGRQKCFNRGKSIWLQMFVQDEINVMYRFVGIKKNVWVTS